MTIEKNKRVISQGEFDAILMDKLENVPVREILCYPGIYEILSEEFNNEVMEAWEDANS